MKLTQPIRDIVELDKIKKYYCDIKPNKRNYLLIVCGLNTALRISDILKLRWKDVYNESLLSFKSHIDVKEKKTGKKTTIFINDNLKEALASYLKEIFEKYPDLPKNCLHIWSANANGVDIQANSSYNPKISKIFNDEDIYMEARRHNNLNISHPGPINCPFDKEKGFKVEKETLAITNLLDSLQGRGKLFAYINYHSTGGLIFQRPSTIPEGMKINKEDIVKKQITNYMLAKTYQDKTYKNTGFDENGNNRRENSKYNIYTKESSATSSNDIFRLNYPQNLLIELSGMGGNPIAPYGDIKGNYTNAINSNLDAVKYTLDVASIAQMISEATYQVIKKYEPDVKYEMLTGVQDIIYKEFSKKIKSLQNIEKEENEEYDR